MTQITHIPKGGRCAACQHRDTDCSWRDFEAMQPLKKEDELTIVKCDGFKRRDADENR